MTTPELMWWMEWVQMAVSVVGTLFSVLVVRHAHQDWHDAKAAGAAISEQANEIARERLITGWFLLWISVFLTVSGVYALILIDSTTLTVDVLGQGPLWLQAYVLRGVWRVSVLAFAFVRWSTRERIRRELQLR